MFEQIDIESSFSDEYWENMTPKKKRKLVGDKSTIQAQQIAPFLSRKKSVIDQLQFIAPLRKNSSFIHPKNHKNNNTKHISEWIDDAPMFGLPSNMHDYQMDEESEDQIPNLKLNKKMTMIDQNLKGIGLKLYKNNSTIQIDHETGKTEQVKYGDNVFIQQIATLERGLNRKESMAVKNNKYRWSDFDDEDTQRLLRDYEITSNINAYVKHHENYLCLNKLQRIFYYVKKITFSNQFSQKQVNDLCSEQIKAYHKDEDGKLLRFYQSWIQEECIYLIFQTASYSLVEKTYLRTRLRENQVWGLLNDCCDALLWMGDQLSSYHLNIKPGNILKCRDNYKLSDPLFNSANVLTVINMLVKQKETEDYIKMSMAYSAPEIIKYRKLLDGLDLHKCDIYSLGISILENITGIPVSILIKNLRSIRKNIQQFMKSYSPALQSLLIKMVHSDPSKRPKASQICVLQKIDDSQKSVYHKRKLSL